MRIKNGHEEEEAMTSVPYIRDFGLGYQFPYELHFL
jgi:hypothetical protein